MTLRCTATGSARSDPRLRPGRRGGTIRRAGESGHRGSRRWVQPKCSSSTPPAWRRRWTCWRVRIAEGHRDGAPLALVGVRTRGVPIAETARREARQAGGPAGAGRGAGHHALPRRPRRRQPLAGPARDRDPVSRRWRRDRPGRRRPLHRPDHPGGPELDLRPRPTRAGPPGRPGRPRPPRTADPGRRRRPGGRDQAVGDRPGPGPAGRPGRRGRPVVLGSDPSNSERRR